jgi:hypothetical protein
MVFRNPSLGAGSSLLFRRLSYDGIRDFIWGGSIALEGGGTVLKMIVLGCCCTGDIFRLSPVGFKVVRYYAGTSLLSLVSPPVEICENSVRLANRFERRTLLNDFRKSFFADLKSLAADYLVIDCINEGWDCLRTSASYVTLSDVLVKSGLVKNRQYGFRRVSRFSPAGEKLWREVGEEFTARLREIIPPERIILHRAMWCEQYREGRRIRSFPPALLKMARQRNGMLAECYDMLAAALPGCHSLDLGKGGFLADKHHVWGLSPYHYEIGYYRRAAETIREIAVGDERLSPEPVIEVSDREPMVCLPELVERRQGNND